jgi:hypothetical protein
MYIYIYNTYIYIKHISQHILTYFHFGLQATGLRVPGAGHPERPAGRGRAMACEKLSEEVDD